jgi:osmotically-inducible protein OsmY
VRRAAAVRIRRFLIDDSNFQPLIFNHYLGEEKMTSKANSLLLGTALILLSAYSAAGTSSEQSTPSTPAPVIVTGTASTDREIRAEAAKRIDEKPALKTENIDVQSFRHDVYLYGIVSNRMDGETAAAIASTVSGVKKVYNATASLGN